MVSRKRKQYMMPMKRRKTNKTNKTKKKKKSKCPPARRSIPFMEVFRNRDVKELVFGEKKRIRRYQKFNPYNEYVYDVDAGTADNPIVL